MADKKMKKALKAYNRIREYCRERESCAGCLFEATEEPCDSCILDFPGHPEEWQDLEIE